MFSEQESPLFRNNVSIATGDESPHLSHIFGVDSWSQLPQYFDYFCILGLLGVTVLTRISYLVKMFVILTLIIAQCCLNVTKLKNSFRWYDTRTYEEDYSIGHEVYLSVVLATIAVSLFIINRQVSFASFIARNERLAFPTAVRAYVSPPLPLAKRSRRAKRKSG